MVKNVNWHLKTLKIVQVLCFNTQSIHTFYEALPFVNNQNKKLSIISLCTCEVRKGNLHIKSLKNEAKKRIIMWNTGVSYPILY